MKAPLEIARGALAALFVDLQEEHRHDPRYLVEDYGRVLANAAALQQAARAAGETLCVKAEPSAFGDALEARLRALGMDWVLIAGVWTEACIDASVKQAVARGFRVLLVKDACGSGSAAMHQTGILNLANRLYRGAVADTATALRILKGETVEAWQVQGAVPIRFKFEDAARLYAEL